VLESAGGGVAVPLLDESGGGFVGLDWSAGGGVLCMELLESGAAGAVVEESEGALGDVDCCFEQATIARALKHNKRRLRFIDHLTVYRVRPSVPPSRRRKEQNAWTQAAFRRTIFNVPASSRLRPPDRPLICCALRDALWGK